MMMAFRNYKFWIVLPFLHITLSSLQAELINDDSPSAKGCSSAITVANSNDTGNGSLRQAVIDICNGGIITVESLFILGIHNAIIIDKEVTIQGISTAVINGGLYGLFDVTPQGDLTVDNLTIAGVSAIDGFGTIRNNGEVSVIDSTLANGRSFIIGGGAIHNNGQLSVMNTSFRQNMADEGGAIYNTNNGVASIVNSTFTENNLGDSNQGAGGVIYNSGIMTITNSSLSDNGFDSPTTKGIYNSGSDALLTFNNSFLYSQYDGVECSNHDGATFTGTNYLIDDGSCNAPLSGDPLVYPFTATSEGFLIIPLQSNSPLINAGDNSVCPPFDQIGNSRPLGGTCEIGSLEFIDTTAPWVSSLEINSKELHSCDSSSSTANNLQIQFTESVLNAEFASNYFILHAGEDSSFDTVDDYLVNIETAISDNHTDTPTITLNFDLELAQGLLQLNISSDITDTSHNSLHNGSGFQDQFRIDVGNFFKNGHFDDCTGVLAIAPWQVVPGDYNSIAAADADNSNSSLSLSKTSGDSPWAIFQCVDMSSELPLFISAYMKEFIVGNKEYPSIVDINCQQYDQQSCAGNSLENLSYSIPDFYTGNQWTEVSQELGVLNPATQSVDCQFSVMPVEFLNFEIFIDKIRLTLQDTIFADGFEID